MLTFPVKAVDIDSLYFNNSHDINSLPAWGPYSKRYAGISHVADIKSGIRFDFSVMPGYYRNKQSVPAVLFESSYYPWNINPAMTRITYRYEMEWKDRVYVDVTYCLIDDARVLVEMKCVNKTAIFQNLVLNNMGYIDYSETYPEIKAVNTEGLCRISAMDYIEAEPAKMFPQYNLVYDGWMRFEDRSSNSVDGSLLAKDFGRDKGDNVTYQIPVPRRQEQGAICFRYRVEKGKHARFSAEGIINTELDFVGTGQFETLKVPYKTIAGNNQLKLISEGESSIELDGFYIGTADAIAKLEFVASPKQFTPFIEKAKNEQDLILKYPTCKNYYGISWNFPNAEIREVLNDELESFFRRKVHDHVSRRFVGNSQWYYANAFLRPVVLQPGSEQTVYTLLCTGDKASVAAMIADFHQTPEKIIELANQQNENKQPILSEGENYIFGKQLLQASLLSNVVYPVYTQREYIRHFTPGKNWNSLYTWDLGFIALGLTDIDPVKAFECVRAYTTEPGAQSAFIHHGTPLPIQFFAYFDLWTETQSKPMLQFLYPRLKQYFEFMTGKNPASTTRMKSSNLLRSWDYFYNSGGWDDYPPQQALREDKSQYALITPVVTTAFYIRAAKILRLAALELGLKNDVKQYDKEIKSLSEGLQKYAWDGESDYYSYVRHDAAGNATGIFRYRDGSNYNKGLDGVSPLISDISTPEQIEAMIAHLFNPKELWSDIGLSTVDRSAAYYKIDGYWNGAVWMPHQWVIWKALLDLGKGDLAFKIANTALNVWEKECEDSYYTFEHFIITSGRGAGWHQFSGLSSPILNWFSSYYKIGKVTTGFEIWLNDEKFNSDYSRYEATLKFDDTTKPHERCMLVCLNPNNDYTAFFNDKPIDFRIVYRGLVQITLPATNEAGKLAVSVSRPLAHFP
jgi:neutral trehalase